MPSREEIQARVDRLSPEQRARLAERLSGAAAAPAIGPRAADVEPPLTYCQQGIRLLLQVFGQHDGAFWNQYSCMRLRGPLDVAALQRALDDVEVRHESLRSTVGDGWPGSQVVHEPGPVPFDVVDVSHFGDPAAEAMTLAAAAREEPFDTASGPVWRCHLYRLGPDDHLLLVVSDHLFSDPWSQGVILRELSALYDAHAAGAAPALAAPSLQYGDYAVWEREWITGAEVDRQREYWTGQFAALQPLQLPTTRPAERSWSTTGFAEPVVIDGALADGVRALSRQFQLTPAITLLAVFNAALALESGRDEVVMATFNLNRNRPETEGVVGLFANMLVLRTDCSGDPSFSTLLTRTRDVLVGALAHSDLPVDQLLSIPGALDAISRDRQDWIVYQFFSTAWGSAPIPGLDVEPFTLTSTDPGREIGTGPIDLHLTFTEDGDAFRGALAYNAEIFDRPWIQAFAARFRQVLGGAIADPTQPLPALT
jgi:hypothetical protein